MAFDETAVDTFVDKVVSHASSLGIFSTVNFHEPKSPPARGARPSYGVWVQSIDPIPDASGLAATSGYVVVWGRIYGNALAKPEDEIDPRLMKAATRLLAAYSGDFDFGGTALMVDLLGAFGEKLAAKAGYLTVSEGMYRVVTVTIPVVFDAMWDQVA